MFGTACGAAARRVKEKLHVDVDFVKKKKKKRKILANDAVIHHFIALNLFENSNVATSAVNRDTDHTIITDLLYRLFKALM